MLAYCALARRDYTSAMLAADGTLAREGAMAAAVAAESGRVVVVTGGFHTVALPETPPALPAPVKVAEADALVALMRYGFEQLDRLNGYASGMPAPEFYQRRWEGKCGLIVSVGLARECRKRLGGASTADAIAALEQTRRLARLRGHGRPSREDLMDGVRSVFIKGSDDVEGVAVLALARKFLAGDRVGDVPPEAGVPPIVEDFRRAAARLRVDLDRVDAREVTLDLYRKSRAREASRFLHRLRFLSVPFAEWVTGPDYVSGERLERVHEIWKYRWTPAAESTLIERSLYGATLEEAAGALILERFDAAEAQGQGRRADVAARLVLEACRMGLHAQAPALVARTGRLVAEDASFVSLVRAAGPMLVPARLARTARSPRPRRPGGDRVGRLRPRLLPPSWPRRDGRGRRKRRPRRPQRPAPGCATLGDVLARRDPGRDRLRDLIAVVGGSPSVRGAALGLLFGDGQATAEELVAQLEGHLLSSVDEGRAGASFVRGLLYSARSALWQVPELLGPLHDALRTWDEDRFVHALPGLRLAFSGLTPRECDRVAGAVAARLGAVGFPAALGVSFWPPSRRGD